MEVSESKVQVLMKGSIFEEIIGELDEQDTRRIIGDPLSSAIACILAMSTQQPIIIENVKRESKNRSIQVTFKIEEAEEQ